MPIFTTISPLKIFLGAWIFTGVLFECKFSYWIDGFDDNFIISFCVTMICFCIGYGIVCLFGNKRKTNIVCVIRCDKIKIYMKQLKRFFIIATIIQVIASGGVPIIWTLTGDSRSYIDFGIHTFNGIVCAVYLIIVLSITLEMILSTTKHKKELLLWLLYPVIIISRQLLISALLELMFLFILSKKIQFKRIAKLAVSIVMTIIIFGYIGDFRTGGSVFLELAAPRYEWLEYLPSGFLWFIIYVTSPLANFQNTINMVEPIQSFSNSLSGLIPSIVRSDFVGSDQITQSALLVSNFNVSSYMDPFYKDYGMLYVWIVTLLIGAISRYIYVKMLSIKNYSMIISYCIICEMLLFSVFSNVFLYLPQLFQFPIAFVLDRYITDRYRCKRE